MGNPYSGQYFLDFFLTLGKRVILFFSGENGVLATDELQLLTLILLSLSCTWVGLFLVQARKTMVANALSHTILLGIVIAFLALRLFHPAYDLAEGLTTGALLVASLVSALLTNFFTEYLTKKMHVQEDASIGLVFTLFFATGVVLLTLFARNAHVGIELVMGSCDSLEKKDLIASCNIFLMTSLLFILFFKEFTLSIFDPSFAATQGIKASLFRYLLLFQTALVAITAFQAVGVVMVLALFVAPILIVRPHVKSMRALLLGSFGVALFSSLVAVALSRHILSYYHVGLSTGALLVVILFIFFSVSRLGRLRFLSNCAEKPHPSGRG